MLLCFERHGYTSASERGSNIKSTWTLRLLIIARDPPLALQFLWLSSQLSLEVERKKQDCSKVSHPRAHSWQLRSGIQEGWGQYGKASNEEKQKVTVQILWASNIMKYGLKECLSDLAINVPSIFQNLQIKPFCLQVALFFLMIFALIHIYFVCTSMLFLNACVCMRSHRKPKMRRKQ